MSAIAGTAEPKRRPVRDVLEFHRRWGEFRPEAVAAMESLPDGQQGVIGWLIALADRIGEADVKTRGE